MVISSKRVASCLLLVLMVFGSVLTVEARIAPGPTPVIPINTQTITDFVDAFVAEQMAVHSIPGLLVAAVYGGEMIFSKGYGYADLAAERPMDPATSGFRAASISKCFTAAALVQLHEKGLIDLHADINNYILGVQVPTTYPEHISVAHLLTHTSGFDDISLATRFDDHELISTLYDDVVNYMPPRVRPPGEILTYSNYGYALAGYIIESVAGMPYEEYITQNLFRPLGMTQTSFLEPAPANLAENLITMYSLRGQEQVELPRLYNNLRPSGSVYSTIEDIARFAGAQLNDGRFGDVSIMSPQSANLMKSTQFTHHPALEGWGYGFVEYNRQGIRVIGHAGDFNGAHTLLFMLPEVDFAFVVHYNTNVSGSYEEDPRNVALEKFIDSFFPEFSLSRSPVVGAAGAVPINLAGYYHTTRYTQTSPAKYLMPNMIAQLVVKQDERGHLFIDMFMGMVEPTEWVPYKDDLFVRVDRETYLSYQLDDRGKVEYVFFNMAGAGATALERVSWYGIYWVIFAFIGFAVIVFAAGVLSWLIDTLIRLASRKRRHEVTVNVRRAIILARSISIVGLISTVVIGILVVDVMAKHNSPLLFMLPVISLAGWLIGIASVVMLWLGWQMWSRGEGSITTRVLISLTPLAGLAFTWFLYFGNMLKFSGI